MMKNRWKKGKRTAAILLAGFTGFRTRRLWERRFLLGQFGSVRGQQQCGRKRIDGNVRN
ncbi:MAG: hypothetical protein LUE90_08135 [Clostridiales bacterium]|nr:hypothetical protein [Clostridiales bacterium]